MPVAAGLVVRVVGVAQHAVRLELELHELVAELALVPDAGVRRKREGGGGGGGGGGGEGGAKGARERGCAAAISCRSGAVLGGAERRRTH